MTRPLKILTGLVLIVGLAMGSAFAAVPTGFEDDGVDYANAETEVAYLAFAMDGDTLVVTLDDDAIGSLPAIAFDVPAVDRYDVLGNNLGAKLTSIDDVEVATTGTILTSLDVTHLSSDLMDLARSYQAQFEALGFSVDVTIHTNHNVATIDAHNGDGAVRVVLHNGADGIDAHFFPV